MRDSIWAALALFLALLAGLEVGRWLRYRHRNDDLSSTDSAATDGVVFAVLGLIIAFTFTSTASRFDERRSLIQSQANAIRKAWLRADLLAESDRAPLRQSLLDWVKLYLEVMPTYAETDPSEFNAKVEEAKRIQDAAWKAAAAAVDRMPRQDQAGLVLDPINDWIDLTNTRLSLNDRGMPPMVMPTLVILSIAASILAGFSMGKHRTRSLLHMVMFSGAIAFSIFVIVDLSNPRSGFIRIDAADNSMKRLYQSMTADGLMPTSHPD